MIPRPLDMEVIHQIKINPVMLGITFLPCSSYQYTTVFMEHHNKSITIVYTNSLTDITDCAISFEDACIFI